MSLTLDALQTVETIARRGSFAAAAAELDKVPSALSYSVRRLEEELDLLIFDRRGRRARLTAAGAELVERGRELLRAANALEHRVQGIAMGWEPGFRIGIDAAIEFDRVAPLIAEFLAIGSPTRLALSRQVLDGGWEALAQGRVDLLIGMPIDFAAEFRATGAIAHAELGEVGFVWCIAPHHPLATEPEPIDVECLRGHRAVVLTDGRDRGLANAPGLLQGQDALVVDTLEQKVAAQVAGLGTGWLPRAAARVHLGSGHLITRRIAVEREPMRVGFGWRRGADGRALRWWRDALGTPRVAARLLDADPAN